jgi:hypothetical protein
VDDDTNCHINTYDHANSHLHRDVNFYSNDDADEYCYADAYGDAHQYAHADNHPTTMFRQHAAR